MTPRDLDRRYRRALWKTAVVPDYAGNPEAFQNKRPRPPKSIKGHSIHLDRNLMNAAF